MKYNAKILVIGTAVNQYWVKVEADSADEAEKKIERKKSVLDLPYDRYP